MRLRTFVKFENCGQYRWTTGFGRFVCMSDSKRFKRVMLGTCCGDMAILPGSKTRSGYMLMETSMAVERVERIERQAEDQSTRSFHWLGRECYGSPLHVAALNRDFDEVQKILQETPHQINSRFTYFSSWGEKNKKEAVKQFTWRHHDERKRSCACLCLLVQKSQAR